MNPEPVSEKWLKEKLRARCREAQSSAIRCLAEDSCGGCARMKQMLLGARIFEKELGVVGVHVVDFSKCAGTCIGWDDDEGGGGCPFPTCESIVEKGPILVMASGERETKEVIRHCSVCGDPQFSTDSGWTCPQGHGGAPSTEELKLEELR